MRTFAHTCANIQVRTKYAVQHIHKNHPHYNNTHNITTYNYTTCVWSCTCRVLVRFIMSYPTWYAVRRLYMTGTGTRSVAGRLLQILGEWTGGNEKGGMPFQFMSDWFDCSFDLFLSLFFIPQCSFSQRSEVIDSPSCRGIREGGSAKDAALERPYRWLEHDSMVGPPLFGPPPLGDGDILLRQ